ncbi:HHL230Wp [Eremothecium sinecaudum]|uniref:aminodeoxychorismate synthase n=1 Tax=Eremothecium sinecaudum TaxID=45286 RepID=A0A0X8HW30_9SACH|nr:HHL230Wp [Eremothecium sinecaudum]AMD22540.1 HHL230Wp [Eremothecium sinecaudum]
MGFRILFIDSYDSFSYNVVQLIRDQGDDIEVVVIHNNTFSSFEKIRKYLDLFDALVVGPGPGNPVNGASDVGIIEELFKSDIDIPILGVCLGMQSMCYAYGCEIKQLEKIKHGQACPIYLHPTADELFNSFESGYMSVRYHSLHVVSLTDKVTPLAYCNDEDIEVLMAAKIVGKPWYGVQYHPESCCSENGDHLIRNFIKIAKTYNQTSGRLFNVLQPLSNNVVRTEEMLQILDECIDHTAIYMKEQVKSKDIYIEKFPAPSSTDLTLQICDRIDSPFFLLASSSLKPNCGEMSILALPSERCTVITHYGQLKKTTIHKWRDPKITVEKYAAALHGKEQSAHIQVVDEDRQQFWSTVGGFVKEQSISNEPDLPFIGGFVGILGYEIGQHTEHYFEREIKPDAKLAFVENSILIDHKSGTIYLISLNNDFPVAVREAVVALLAQWKTAATPKLEWPTNLPADVKFNIKMPLAEAYEDAFNKVQEYLHQGQSYEICITTQTKITPDSRIEPWRIFQTLVVKNPAPFSSYINFSDITPEQSDMCLISTSPERFIKWTPDTCELRPIKGTVKKVPGITTEQATAILKTPKELGENLMILDLIRNDLFELLPRVSADDIMRVEEYETVYQLVSVVKAHEMEKTIYSGLDVLKHSLPPGSMTGAPKKRTVELLQHEIEDKLNSHLPECRGIRGIYSGTTGYISVNGNSDWSVNIRCMYSYDNGSNWYIGAGGAITVLSTLDGEWEEMHTKLEAALQVFQ